jgi:hypothetical protein
VFQTAVGCTDESEVPPRDWQAQRGFMTKMRKPALALVATPETIKRCKCGHDRHHAMVTASGEYTFGGWCLVFLGISAQPRAIKYQCRRCDQMFDQATDKTTIEQTRLWG